MVTCKRCASEQIVRNGVVREKPRYKCKACGLNFIAGDRRVKEAVAVKKALAVILYSLGKSSFGMLGKIFGHSRSLTYRWIVEEAAKLPEPVLAGEIKEMEFEELWHFLGSKKEEVAHQSGGSWLTANCCLGCRRS
jgi:transposase